MPHAAKNKKLFSLEGRSFSSDIQDSFGSDPTCLLPAFHRRCYHQLNGMANQNPLAGVVPQVVHPVNDGETTITEHLDKIEGEVALDTYVKAQTSAPEVVKRITELENCLWQLANAILTSPELAKHPELRAAAEQAKLVLKNRVEIDDAKHHFRTELGSFPHDDLRILKD